MAPLLAEQLGARSSGLPGACCGVSTPGVPLWELKPVKSETSVWQEGLAGGPLRGQ